MTTVAVLARIDADPEQVRLEAIRQASTLGGNIIGEPDIQTSGTIQANGEPVTLDDSGLALYTWPLHKSFTSLDNISPALLPPRVL